MFGLNKYVLIVLASSVAANAGLSYLYKEALQDTARVQLQEQLDRARSSQETTQAAALAQAAASAITEASLVRRLQLSDQVARQHADRAAAAYEELTEFERSLGNRRIVQPDYANWADIELPAGVADELRRLDVPNSALNAENE